MATRGALAATLAVLVLAGCGGSDLATGRVVELTGVDQLRSAFAADEGTPRLLLVLSPT